MKILFVCGSRNTQGQTARAVNAIIEGVTGAEAETELIFLPTMELERCRQCEESGWGICRQEGACIIEDEFAGLVQKIRLANAVVFATPVYYGDLCESMRAMTDRLRRICTHSDGRNGIQDKPAIGLCVAGGGGGGSLTACISLERVLNGCGFEVLDMVPARRQNLKAKLNILRLTGAWLVTATKLKLAAQ